MKKLFLVLFAICTLASCSVNDRYCRIHGLGESMLLSISVPLFVLFGAWLGFKTGMNNTEFNVSTELPSNTIVQTSAKHAIADWSRLSEYEIQPEDCD